MNSKEIIKMKIKQLYENYLHELYEAKFKYMKSDFPKYLKATKEISDKYNKILKENKK